MDTKVLKNGYIEFCGYNATEVTGSANLVRFLQYHYLVDYGMRQTSDEEKDHVCNMKRHKSIKPKQLDGIILTHCHIDHSGLIPKLYAEGANCPLYIPSGTKGLLTLMWQDSVKIFNHDYERFDRKPLYTQEDVENALKYVIECELYDRVNLNDKMNFTYINAQHIVGARQVFMECYDKARMYRIGFTGDISNYKSRYWLDNLDIMPKCNIVVGECTYANSNRNHSPRDRQKDLDKIDYAVMRAKERNAKIIMPTFSLNRMQDVLAMLYEHFNGRAPIKILVDSPLGMNINKLWDDLIIKDFALWDKIKNWDNVYYIEDFKDSVHFSKLNEPLLVIAGGGMLRGGRARFWVKECVSEVDNVIMFTGYATPESLAGRMRQGRGKYMQIDDKLVNNNALPMALKSLSSHCDATELARYYTDIQYNRIYLVHGDQDYKLKFAKELQAKLERKDRTSRVICTQSDTKAYFSKK